MTKRIFIMAISAAISTGGLASKSNAEGNDTFCGKVISAKFEDTTNGTTMSIRTIDAENRIRSMELPMKNGKFSSVNTDYTYTIRHNGNKIISISKGCLKKTATKSDN